LCCASQTRAGAQINYEIHRAKSVDNIFGRCGHVLANGRPILVLQMSLSNESHLVCPIKTQAEFVVRRAQRRLYDGDALLNRLAEAYLISCIPHSHSGVLTSVRTGAPVKEKVRPPTAFPCLKKASNSTYTLARSV
jgi:hypothetical protein